MSTPKPGLSITMKTPPAYRTHPWEREFDGKPFDGLNCHVKMPINAWGLIGRLHGQNLIRIDGLLDRWQNCNRLAIRTLSQMEVISKK